jgi:hypothetical protein
VKIRPRSGFGHRQFHFPPAVSDRDSALHLRSLVVVEVTEEEWSFLKPALAEKVDVIPTPATPARTARILAAAALAAAPPPEAPAEKKAKKARAARRRTAL